MCTSHASDKSIDKSGSLFSKKKGDRGQLKVSINETAELIEDQNEDNKLSSSKHFSRKYCDDENTLQKGERDKEGQLLNA